MVHKQLNIMIIWLKIGEFETTKLICLQHNSLKSNIQMSERAPVSNNPRHVQIYLPIVRFNII